jgi:hypothetical protein
VKLDSEITERPENCPLGSSGNTLAVAEAVKKANTTTKTIFMIDD